jgi:peptide/nickel transport system permease protein
MSIDTVDLRAGRRGRRLVRASIALPAAILILFVISAVFGPLLVPYDPVATDNAVRLLPPGSRVHGGIALLGTDQLGRDLLAQVVAGARISLIVTAATILLGGTVGTILGIAAGYFRGPFGSIVMRIADIQFAFPAILLAILIAGVLGPSMWNVVLTLSVTRWVFFARVARASTLAVAQREFVASARVIGVSQWGILTRYILPFCTAPLLVLATTQLGLVVIGESSLSFLGLGVPAGETSWGAMISTGRDYLGTAWWIATVPGIALAAIVVSAGLLSDALRDRIDDKVFGVEAPR